MSIRSIADRVQDYLHAVVTALEEQEALLQAFIDTPVDSDVAALIESDAEFQRTMERFQRDKDRLQVDWSEAEDIQDTRRQEVAALAVRAEQLVQSVSEKLGTAMEVAKRARGSIHGELDKIGQGREMLEGYRPGLSHGGGFVDRKA